MHNKRLQISHHRYGIQALIQIHKIEKGLLVLSVLQAILEAVFPYIELVCAARIIDLLIEANFAKAVQITVVLAIFIFLGGLLLDALSSIHTYKSDRAHRKMLRRVNQKAMELDYEEMENTELLHKISDSVYSMNHIGGYNVFLGYYNKLLKNATQVLISFAAVLRLSTLNPSVGYQGWVSWVSSPAVSFCILMLVTVGNFLISNEIAARFKRYSSSGYQEKMKVERKLNYFADKVFMNGEMGKEIRLFDMLELIIQKHSMALNDSLRFYNKYYDDAAKNQETLHTITQGLCTLAAYVVVICKVLSGAASIGELSQYIGSIVLLNQAIRMCLTVNQKIALQTGFVKTFQDFIKIKSKKDSGSIRIQQIPGKSYCIEFHHVSFRYKGTETDAVKDVSCKITSHTRVAIVGKNGAGKTTFVKLLCRLYEPTEGRITLNGVDIRDYCYEDYLALFSVVFQDFSLFSFPIGENVAAGMGGHKEKIWDCLKKAGIQERVQQMPHQLDTNLYKYDEDSSNISGGEAQKIAIARALYKDAPFVILDEPTAALDPESEYEIFSTFDRLVQGKGSIFISHRMGSCRFCQEMFVLVQGKVVQNGSHEDLIKKEGIYQELFLAQADCYMD